MTLEAQLLGGPEVDIDSRKRALLLSRNSKRPPQTPYSSEEQARGRLLDLDYRATTDSSANRLNLSIHFPEGGSILSGSADMANDRRLSNSESAVIRTYSPTMRTSTSVNGLQASKPHASYSEQESSCCRPAVQRGNGEKSWLPQLELRNLEIEPPKSASCLDFGARVPLNDAEIHANDLECCPPCEPERENSSRYLINRTTLPGKQLRAEPTDLACFLAGRPPGQINCRKHHSISSRQHENPNTQLSPSSSTNLSDKFPHAVQSLNAAITETQLYSAIINTNFSLPGPKIQHTMRNDQNRGNSRRRSKALSDSASHRLRSSSLSGTEKQDPVDSNNPPWDQDSDFKKAPISAKFSNGSLKPRKPQSTSLKSGASKTSLVFQHSLLKTSVSASHPVDIGLPLPPKLTAISTTFIAPPLENPSTALDKLESGPSLESQGETQSVKTVVESEQASSDVRPDVASKFSPDEPLNFEHINFDPDIKKSLLCAVQVTIRKTIEDVFVPSDDKPVIVANAYRRLVAQSLAEAAEDADKSLRRTSFWDKLDRRRQTRDATTPLESEGVSDGTQPNVSRATEPHSNNAEPLKADCTTIIHSSTVKPSCPDPPLIPLRATKDRESSEKPTNSDDIRVSVDNEHTAQKSTSLTENEIEIEPRGREDSLLVKKPRVSKRRMHAVVPNRHSSKHRSPNPKDCDENNIDNQKKNSSKGRDISLPEPEVDCGLLKASRTSQSESSVDSGNYPCPDDEHQMEQLLVLSKQHDPQKTTEPVYKPSPNQLLGGQNTVHWLQDLLSGKGSYQPQLTGLPLRKRHHENSSEARLRSQSLPVNPAAHFLLDDSSEVLNARVDVKKLLEPANNDSKAWAPVTFTKTINDLENLLNEALVIARLAAEENIRDPTTKPHTEQRHVSSGSFSESEINSVGSIRESTRGHSEGSDSTEGETDHLYRQDVQQHPRGTAITIGKLSEPNRRPSGWPPSGRGPTPYPPNSNPPSKESIFVDVPLLESIKPENKESQLHTSSRPKTSLASKELRHFSGPQLEFTTAEPFKPLNDSPNKSINASSSHNSPDLKTHRLWQGLNLDKAGLGVETKAGKARNESDRQDQNRLLQGANKSCSSAKEVRHEHLPYSCSLDGSQLTRSEEIDFKHGYGHRQHGNEHITKTASLQRNQPVELKDAANPNLRVTSITNRKRDKDLFNLKNTRHVSLRDHIGFSFTRSHKRQAIARDWSPGRKRFCAAVACISTALVGILVGIYAGETPAIQYWIVDFHHYTVLGNVFFFIGLSIPTFLFWPLPLLHGRKPYILGAMSLAMPLLFPQAVAVGQFRSPYVSVWRVALLLPRALMGFCLGFANMNFKSILTDLFGASLQSNRPHQEHVDEFDVRRHGGGLGVWLALWAWSAMGSIGLGFLIGAVIINDLPPVWGFYISIIIIAFVLFLNILTPEVRRSAYRRSVAEVKNCEQVSRRLARGEVKMHLVQTGPKWWGEEFLYGLKLSIKMIKQPGFAVMATYVAWMYGQIVLIVLLLGSLCSNSYRFKAHQVGAAVAVVPVGALLAIPFQKASLFSRDRHHDPNSDEETYKKKIKWSSHLVRRAIFVLTLPFAGLAYTLSARGPPIPLVLPILFAGLIAFLSNLAMAECHGIMMETYDTSDLQPGMTGRSRGSAGDKYASKRTNYSSFPRVASGFAITQGLGYLIAAAASGTGGSLTRNFGQQAASGIMAFILLILSLMLLGVLVRFKEVQIIPKTKNEEMEQYQNARTASANRHSDEAQEEEPLRPIIIGNPQHSTRRMSILELGSMSRFSEIRLKNRLIDEQSLEARHPNQQMMIDVKLKIREKELQVVQHVRRSLSRGSSRTSLRSKLSEDVGQRIVEQGDLGGHREMGRMHSGNGSGRRRATDIRE